MSAHSPVVWTVCLNPYFSPPASRRQSRDTGCLPLTNSLPNHQATQRLAARSKYSASIPEANTGYTSTHYLQTAKPIFAESYDKVEVTETDDGQGTTTLRIEVNTGKIPDVEPETGSGSSFDVDVNGWENDINTDIPII